jgi:hypothetical protein
MSTILGMILFLCIRPWILKQLVNSITLPRSIFNYKKLIIMDQFLSMQLEKKLITTKIASYTICPRCFSNKRHLSKAMDESKDVYNYQLIWIRVTTSNSKLKGHTNLSGKS